MAGKVELPKETDLVKFVQDVYELSGAQGMGWMHFTPKPISREEAQQFVEPTGRWALSLDYVAGRACKMTVFRDMETGVLSLNAPWYDHSDEALTELLSRHGVTWSGSDEHSLSCNCPKCRFRQASNAD